MSYVNFARAARAAGIAALLLASGVTGSVAYAGNAGQHKVNRDTTVTRANGKTVTRHTTVVNDRAGGTRSVDSTATGPDGRTTTYSSDARRTDNGYQREVTRTSPQGVVTGRSIAVACDKTSRTCSKTVTGGG